MSPWWRKCIIHSGVLLLPWLIFVLYSYFQNEVFTIQGIMHFCSFWFITIWALTIMREGDSNTVIYYRRLLFLPIVLLVIALAHWYGGETYFDIFIIITIAFFWFLPFLFKLDGKKLWFRILLLLVAGLMTVTGLSITPAISGIERLRSGNQRLLRYSDIVIEDRNFSVSEMELLSGSKFVLRLEITSMESTKGLFNIISTIPRLETLVLRNMKIAGKETEQLATLEKLKRIILENVEVTDNSLGNINCKHLETLTLKNTAVSFNDIIKITQIKSLKNLALIGQVVPYDRIQDLNDMKDVIEGLNITIGED